MSNTVALVIMSFIQEKKYTDFDSFPCFGRLPQISFYFSTDIFKNLTADEIRCDNQLLKIQIKCDASAVKN
jgi:hypothetical protein